MDIRRDIKDGPAGAIVPFDGEDGACGEKVALFAEGLFDEFELGDVKNGADDAAGGSGGGVGALTHPASLAVDDDAVFDFVNGQVIEGFLPCRGDGFAIIGVDGLPEIIQRSRHGFGEAEHAAGLD